MPWIGGIGIDKGEGMSTTATLSSEGLDDRPDLQNRPTDPLDHPYCPDDHSNSPDHLGASRPDESAPPHPPSESGPKNQSPTGRPKGLRRYGMPHMAVHLDPPSLRTADGHDQEERRASWLELFFDLVFAGAVGQLAGALQDHPTLHGVGRFGMLFVPIWWLWVQFSFYADRHESEDTAHRVAFLSAILLCLGLGAGAPRALAGDTDGFIIAFASLRALQLVLYARARYHLPATRALYSRFLVFFGAGGALWLVALAFNGPARYAVVGVALLVDTAGALAMTSPRRRVPLNTTHLAARFQMFVLIVLGESVSRLIGGAADRPWSPDLAVVLAAALIILAALWWAWLKTVQPGALEGPRAIARFTALNLPIVGGVAAASAGLHLAILAAAGSTTIGLAPRVALYGGVALYLLSTALLPSCHLGTRARVVRIATSAGALGLIFMGSIVLPVFLVPALTGVLVVGLVFERRRFGAVASERAPFMPARAGLCPES
jgi:low temperature requirement protein LtrA